jgi:hypothetical protein
MMGHGKIGHDQGHFPLPVLTNFQVMQYAGIRADELPGTPRGELLLCASLGK